MPGIADIHCHVLPGVDDGPATMQESMDVLREAVRQGIDTMIVTPHYHPGRYMVPASQVLDTLESVREQAKREGLSIRLLPGQECCYHSDLVKELKAGKALTMAGTRFVLVEFDPEESYSTFRFAIRELTGNGYYPIIAHYERYRCLLGREERLEELRNANARLQLNFDRLLEKDGLLHRNRWRAHLREGYVDFLGSDTHGMDFRPLHVDRAVQWLYQNAGKSLAEQILIRNLRPLIGSH